jgi:hypothetical protein
VLIQRSESVAKMSQQSQCHHPTCPIQRLLIFHQNFATKCRGGKPFSETSSIEELHEQILFYHRDPRLLQSNSGINDFHSPSTTQEMEEAVQFVGLVTALYHISESLGEADNDDDSAIGNDRTLEVYFGQSTLIFVPLESEFSDDIVAVAQVARLSNGAETGSSGGNPLAVRRSIKSCHRLLCMLHGGGIVNRLGLKEPILDIRKDLDMHYNEFLGDLSTSSSRVGCSTRCIVAGVPSPIPHMAGKHIFQAVPVTLTPSACVNIDSSINAILHDVTPSIIGVSTFAKGSLIKTHLHLGGISARVNIPKNNQNVSIEDESASLIMGYMSSYELKMNQHSSTDMLESNAQNALLGLKKFTLSLTNADAAQVSQHIGLDYKSRDKERRRFLEPPPPSMMGATELAQSFLQQDGSQIWSLSIHLPIRLLSNEDKESTTLLKCHVIMFSYRSFSFLIYLPDDEGIATSAIFFDNLAQRLIAACIFTIGVNPEMEVISWDKKGQDIIFVNRSNGQFALFSDRQAMVNSKNNLSNQASSPKRSMFSFKNKSEDWSSSPQTIPYSPTPDWLVLGLDCRHRLGSLLPLDILLAFDDVMNEVALQRKINTLSEETGKPVEYCTNMRHGWIYAYALGDRELYAFFDIEIYVTVSDVQSAAQVAREEIFEQRWSL